MGRFFRPGTQGVIRALLDAREARPTNYIDTVQPGLEARALRGWEKYFEDIWLLHRSLVAGAGAAGQETFVAFNAGSGIPLDTPSGKYLLVIKRIVNQSAQAVDVRLVTAFGAVANFTQSGWQAQDLRLGSGQLLNGMVQTGDTAAPAGVIIGHTIPAAGGTRDYPDGLVLPMEIGSVLTIAIYGGTAATAVSVGVDADFVTLR